MKGQRASGYCNDELRGQRNARTSQCSRDFFYAHVRGFPCAFSDRVHFRLCKYLHWSNCAIFVALFRCSHVGDILEHFSMFYLEISRSLMQTYCETLLPKEQRLTPIVITKKLV